MLDLGRVAALVWTLFAIGRTRRWPEAGVLAFAAYLLGLEITAGITIRSQGAQEPILAILLVLLGPSGMPPGPIPELPLAWLVRLPATAHALASAALAVPFVTLARRAARLMPESSEAAALDRAALAFLLAATLEGLEAGALSVPRLLSSEL
jgi:hypothetical protein